MVIMMHNKRNPIFLGSDCRIGENGDMGFVREVNLEDDENVLETLNRIEA